MKRIALLTALVAVAACSKGDKGAADTTAASATVAPATDSAGGAMSTSSQSAAAAAQRTADSAHMAASGTATPAPDYKTGGAMGGDSAGMSGTHNDTTKKKP